MNLTQEGPWAWEAMASMPEHRSTHEMVSVRNLIYLIGGTYSSSDLFIYHIGNDSWSTLPSQLVRIAKYAP